MTLSSEQFHTLYNGAAQPVILVRDGAVAELNCHAQELFAVGTALRAYLPQDAALPEMLYARPAVLPVMAGGVCVSANTQPLDDALLLFLPPQDTRDDLCAADDAAVRIRNTFPASFRSRGSGCAAESGRAQPRLLSAAAGIGESDRSELCAARAAAAVAGKD